MIYNQEAREGKDQEACSNISRRKKSQCQSGGNTRETLLLTKDPYDRILVLLYAIFKVTSWQFSRFLITRS